MVLTVRDSTYREQFINRGLQETDEIQVVESAKVCGETFQSGMFVMLAPEDPRSVVPCFALIIDVVAEFNSSNVLLGVSRCRNCHFSSKYNSYKVLNEFEENHELVDIKHLANHRPIAPWNALDRADNALYLYCRTVSV